MAASRGSGAERIAEMRAMPLASPATASAQFSINVANNEFLNKEKAQDKVGYAVFGKVVEGMDVVNKIVGVKTTSKGPHQNVPTDPVIIKSVKVVEAK